jgi:hypothetical protein
MHKAKTPCQQISLGERAFFPLQWRVRNKANQSISALAASTSSFSMASRGSICAALA